MTQVKAYTLPTCNLSHRVGRGHDGYCYEHSAVIAALGYAVLSESVGDDGYQGDIVVILRDGDRYGFVVDGYGSCSGCDALYACEDEASVLEYMRQADASIEWASSLPELHTTVEQRAHEGNRYWVHEKSLMRAIAEVFEKATV